MIRDALSEQLDQDPEFKWRGQQVTRIENLSDIVFALALGMIVTATNEPLTYTGIRSYLVGLVPVAAAFATMLVIWNHHFIYFRRYGLADRWIVFLNACLLFLILAIAFPLRFIFDSLFAWILTLFGNNERMIALDIRSYRQAGVIVAYFGLIYAVVQSFFAMMYSHALRKADTLGLSESEQRKTRQSIWTLRIDTVLGLSVAVIAGFTLVGPFAGFLTNFGGLISRLINRWIK